MNTRARNRLIGVTVLILLVAAAVFWGSNAFGDAAYEMTVSKVLGDKTLVGKRVKVSGLVVAGSWDKKTDPMIFKISDPETDPSDANAPQVKVVYTGNAPNTFGAGSNAIVTGTLEGDGTIKSNNMTVKCPSKYESRSGSASIKDLLASKSGSEMPVSGYLKAGSLKPAGADVRFVLTATATGGDEVPVVFEETMPDGAKDGAGLVVTGTLVDGKLVARKVALSK